MSIALMRPQLPGADRLVPYLRRIDASRHYANSGPLLGELEARLAAQFGVEPGHVACVANATIGLSLCLMALEPRGQACIAPSWTFEATAVAIRAAGLEPWFHDVNDETWSLRAADVLQSPACEDDSAAAVIAVSPFGGALDRLSGTSSPRKPAYPPSSTRRRRSIPWCPAGRRRCSACMRRSWYRAARAGP